MKVLTSIGYGGAQIADEVVRGGTRIVCDGGAGKLYGLWVGPSPLVGGWEGPRQKIDRLLARQFFASIRPQTILVSNYFELRYDDEAIEQVSIILSEAKRAGLVVGHYNAVSRRPPTMTKAAWRARHDRAMKVWKPHLHQINPDVYFRTPGELCRGEVVQVDKMITAEMDEIAELITEARRCATTTEEVVPVLSDRSISGQNATHPAKNRQLVAFLESLGIKTIAIWTDKAGNGAARDIAMSSLAATSPEA